MHMYLKAIAIVFLMLIPAGNNQPVFANSEEVANVPKTVVYYFHGNSRCRTCLTIEKYTRQAVNNGFADELEKGEMELRAVNVDLKENRHFIQDYQLFSRSVVLSVGRTERKPHGNAWTGCGNW
ncbi:MAG TPA: hypothetical protein ENN40_11630 [Candidatus Aminicenantes bacterium]|nr:hypothetical protein [Candidatus Aminicenantes bacterium]